MLKYIIFFIVIFIIGLIIYRDYKDYSDNPKKINIRIKENFSGNKKPEEKIFY